MKLDADIIEMLKLWEEKYGSIPTSTMKICFELQKKREEWLPI